MARTRTGKLARLPADIREQVNQRLHAGEPAAGILAWLHQQESVLRILDEHFGETPITPQNLSEWRQGGYQDWLQRREKVLRVAELASHAARIAEANGDLMTAPAAIVGGQLLEILEDLDPNTQRSILADNPGNYIDLVEALAKIQKSGAEVRRAQQAEASADLARQRLQLDLAKFQRSTCELFLKWHADHRAREIADSKGQQSVKIEDLRQLMFGPTDEHDEQVSAQR